MGPLFIFLHDKIRMYVHVYAYHTNVDDSWRATRIVKRLHRSHNNKTHVCCAPYWLSALYGPQRHFYATWSTKDSNNNNNKEKITKNTHNPVYRLALRFLFHMCAIVMYFSHPIILSLVAVISFKCRHRRRRRRLSQLHTRATHQCIFYWLWARTKPYRLLLYAYMGKLHQSWLDGEPNNRNSTFSFGYFYRKFSMDFPIQLKFISLSRSHSKLIATFNFRLLDVPFHGYSVTITLRVSWNLFTFMQYRWSFSVSLLHCIT